GQPSGVPFACAVWETRLHRAQLRRGRDLARVRGRRAGARGGQRALPGRGSTRRHRARPDRVPQRRLITNRLISSAALVSPIAVPNAVVIPCVRLPVSRLTVPKIVTSTASPI